MWQEIAQLKILKPRINKSGQLVYGISPQDAGFTYEQLLDISVGYDNYRDFLTEECLRFETFAGKPVVECFNPLVHTANYPGVNDKLPLILSFDFGGTNPAYSIMQNFTGRLVVHMSYAPRRQPGYEVDLESICKRLQSEFRDTQSKFYHKQCWQFVVIGDHTGTYENNQGIPGKASEIVSKYFSASMISYPMTADVYRQSIAVVIGVFAQNNLICINPENTLAIDTVKGGWRYDEKVEEQAKPKPLPLWPYIHVADTIRYPIWHFFRPDDATQEEYDALKDADSEFLTLEKMEGFHFGR